MVTRINYWTHKVLYMFFSSYSMIYLFHWSVKIEHCVYFLPKKYKCFLVPSTLSGNSTCSLKSFLSRKSIVLELERSFGVFFANSNICFLKHNFFPYFTTSLLYPSCFLLTNIYEEFTVFCKDDWLMMQWYRRQGMSLLISQSNEKKWIK